MQKIIYKQNEDGGDLNNLDFEISNLLGSMIDHISSSLLIEYAKRGDLEGIKFGLEHGYKADMPSYQRKIPLDKIIKMGNSEAALLILKHSESTVISRDGDLGKKVRKLAKKFVDTRVQEEVQKAHQYLLLHKHEILSKEYKKEEKKRVAEDFKKLSRMQKKKFRRILKSTKKPDVDVLLKTRQELLTELFYQFACDVNFSTASLFIMMRARGSEAFQLNGKNLLYILIKSEIKATSNPFSLNSSLNSFIVSLLKHDIDNALSSFDSDDFTKLLDVAAYRNCKVEGVYRYVKIMTKLIPLYVALRKGDSILESLLNLGSTNVFYLDYEHISNLRELMERRLTTEARAEMLSNPDTRQIFTKLMLEPILIQPFNRIYDVRVTAQSNCTCLIR